MEEHMLKYPIWMRVFLYFGIALFPGLSAFFLFYCVSAFIEQGVAAGIILLLPVIFMLWLSKFGVMLLRFVWTEVNFDDNEFSISVASKIQRYQWSDVREIKNFSTAQVLQLLGRNGETLFAVDHKCPGYSEFEAVVYDKVKI